MPFLDVTIQIHLPSSLQHDQLHEKSCQIKVVYHKYDVALYLLWIIPFLYLNRNSISFVTNAMLFCLSRCHIFKNSGVMLFDFKF